MEGKAWVGTGCQREGREETGKYSRSCRSFSFSGLVWTGVVRRGVLLHNWPPTQEKLAECFFVGSYPPYCVEELPRSYPPWRVTPAGALNGAKD